MGVLQLEPGRLGRCLGEARVGGARVNRATYAAGSQTPAHTHPHGDLCVLLEGRYEERWGGRGANVARGQVVLKPPGIEHVDRFGPEDVTCLNVVFTPAAWGELVGLELDGPLVVDEPSLVQLAYELGLELGADDRASAVTAEGLVLSLVTTALRTGGRVRGGGARRWLDEVRERLHRDYATMLHLDDLAAEAGVHPAYLTRCFRRRFGHSIGQYVTALRVGAALRGIAELDRTLADVAVAAGFSDQSHMGRVLRRETGRTPGRWRARFRERWGRSGSGGFGSF